LGEVVDLAARRAAKKQVPSKTMEEVIEQSIDFLQGDWEKMKRNDRLNDYFKRSLANTIDHASQENFMTDLNAVAKIEINLAFSPIVHSPGTQDDLGWCVEFKLTNGSASWLALTPHFPQEAQARCFALLLYLKAKREAHVAGLM
jgi:hypothetical protein